MSEDTLGAAAQRWQDERARIFVEAYVSAGDLLLDRGHVDAAHALTDELLRRFPTWIGTPAFMALDARLAAAFDRRSHTTPARPRRKPTPCPSSPSPPSSPTLDADAEPAL